MILSYVRGVYPWIQPIPCLMTYVYFKQIPHLGSKVCYPSSRIPLSRNGGRCQFLLYYYFSITPLSIFVFEKRSLPPSPPKDPLYTCCKISHSYLFLGSKELCLFGHGCFYILVKDISLVIKGVYPSFSP